MDIIEFKNNLINEVKFRSSAEGTTDKEEFINYVAEILIGAEVVEDFTPLFFEGLGKQGRKIQINGYHYSDLDDSLSLFVAPPLTSLLDDTDSNDTLTNSDAEKIFTRVKAFIEDKSYIIDKAEPASPGYGLAIEIDQLYKNTRKFRFFLLTDMVMSKSIKELESDEVTGKPAEYQIWDLSRLYQLDQSNIGKEEIVIDLKKYIDFGIPCLSASMTNDYTAYLCNMPGILLANLYNEHGSRLLEGNVRSFLQVKGKVNKAIRNTILNDPSMFFAYNNGIAATCENIEFENIDGKEYITKVTSLQIVNGGQTTASLAMALIKDKADDSEQKIKNIFVPMKLSVVSHEKAQTLIPNISRFANSQNKVSEADLWSNHPFHIRMEDFSRRIRAPAAQGLQYETFWYYERANGQYKQETYKSTESERKNFALKYPSNQMFKKIDLAKYMNLKQMRPDIASTGGQKGFSKFAIWAAEQWDKNDSVFNEEFFKEIVAMAIINKTADRIISHLPWYNSYKANIVAYTVSKIFYTVEHDYPKYAISLKAIWAKQSLSQAWTQQIEDVSKLMYDHLINPSRQVENVTEWAKREKCWEGAKEIAINLSPEFINELVDKTTSREEEKHAIKDQKVFNKTDAIVDVYKYGKENWKKLIEWDEKHHVLLPRDIDMINVAISGKIPSEKQSVLIMEILEKARINSFSL
jgi:hypothetical protein